MITRLTRPALLMVALCFYGMHNAQTTTDAAPGQKDEFAKKKPETKLQEVVTTDSLPPDVLMKRAAYWVKQEHLQYRKYPGSTTGNKTECVASFPVKPKALNPEVDYTGKITMKVTIECKNSRYRYTVYDIRHESKNGLTTAGSIDNEIPECGSVAMQEIVWKKLKAEALHNAALVVSDITKAMSEDPIEVNDDDW